MNRNRHLRIMCCFWDDYYKTCTRDSYTFEREIRADEQDRILSIVSRCIAHNIYNVSEGIALFNEIKEELKEQSEV